MSEQVISFSYFKVVLTISQLITCVAFFTDILQFKVTFQSGTFQNIIVMWGVCWDGVINMFWITWTRVQGWLWKSAFFCREGKLKHTPWVSYLMNLLDLKLSWHLYARFQALPVCEIVNKKSNCKQWKAGRGLGTRIQLLRSHSGNLHCLKMNRNVANNILPSNCVSPRSITHQRQILYIRSKSA